MFVYIFLFIFQQTQQRPDLARLMQLHAAAGAAAPAAPAGLPPGLLPGPPGAPGPAGLPQALLAGKICLLL